MVIRITYNRKTTYLPLGFNLPEKEFDAKNQRIRSSSNIASNINRINNRIQEKVKKVYDTVTQLEKEGKIEAQSMPLLKEKIDVRKSTDEDFFVLISQVILKVYISDFFNNYAQSHIGV